MDRITIIDAMNIMFIESSIAIKELERQGKEFNEENEPFFLHLLIQKLNYIFSTYNNVIFCWEGKNSTKWRKSLYPDYKENRKKARDQDSYKRIIANVEKIKNLLNYYPCKQICVDNCEGDDEVFAICEKYHKDKEVTVLSSDKDFIQLKNFFNVDIYNPIRREFIKENKYIIEEKAVCGDNSDNIPGLQRIGKKTFEKMISSKDEWNKIIAKGNNRYVYDLFKKIVDLSEFPKEYSERVKEIEEKTPFNDFRPDKVEEFLFENKLSAIKSNWDYLQTEIAAVNNIKMGDVNLSSEYVKKEISEEDDEIDKVLKEYL